MAPQTIGRERAIGRERGQRFHELAVADVEPLCDDAAAITFVVPEDLSEEYAFAAGQSLTIRRHVDGVEQRRSYSICAPVGERPRVGVRAIPDGLFSTWMVRDVRPGDVVEVGTPTGAFGRSGADVEHAEQGGRHLCVAAGSGITPMLSIIATVLAHPDACVTLLYGNRTTRSVMFAEELADLKDRYGARLELVHVLSREPRDVELFSGRLDPDRLRRLLETLVPVGDLDDVWLCGPYPMITGAREVLADLGVPSDRVHTELFFVDEPPPDVERPAPVVDAAAAELTLVLNGVRSTVPVPPGTSVLDAAMATRADLPFACKGGVCGTCRAHLRAGEVEMRRNYALDADEVARGFVLTCQALPLSSQVTVDFDA